MINISYDPLRVGKEFASAALAAEMVLVRMWLHKSTLNLSKKFLGTPSSLGVSFSIEGNKL